jgi:hypothetical protein
MLYVTENLGVCAFNLGGKWVCEQRCMVSLQVRRMQRCHFVYHTILSFVLRKHTCLSVPPPILPFRAVVFAPEQAPLFFAYALCSIHMWYITGPLQEHQLEYYRYNVRV